MDKRVVKAVSCIGACLVVILSVLLVFNLFQDSRTRHIYSQNKRLADSCVAMLHSGDVALRMGLGADSYMLARMNRKNQSYSHCGIVMMENGYPFVYHSIGGEDNPDQRMRRDSAIRFFSPAHNTAIAVVHYDFRCDELQNLVSVVLSYYRKRPKFDMNFDLSTDDYLYCAEFVYKSIVKATSDTAFIGTTSCLGRRYVGIDDLFINPHASLIAQARFK